MASYLQQFNFQIFGNAGSPRLVFLHGLMGGWVNWKRVISALEPRFQILAFDQRGHGQSFHPPSGYSPDDYAEDLYLISEELGWSHFSLVGHSMGGRNAFVFASRFPAKVDRLVVEDMGPEAKPHSVDDYKMLLGQIPTPFATKREAKEFFMNDFQNIHWERDPKTVLGSFLYMNIVELPDGRADWRFSKRGILDSVSEGRGRDQWQEWESVSCENLVIRGENSRELSPEVFQEMLKRNSRAQGALVPNAGHWVHSDQPERFIQILEGFLQPLL